MKLIINSKKYDIPSISSLSFGKFNKVVLQNEVLDIKSYIAAFIDMPVTELMSAEIKSSSMPALHASIFDVDIEKTIKGYPETFSFDGGIHELKDLRLSTFGENVVFDLYYESFAAKRISLYELSVYAMACYLSDSYDMSDIEVVYQRLIKENWRDVLPASFFLVKKLLKKKRNYLLLSIVCTLELKKIKHQSSYRGKRFKSLAKSLQGNYFAKYLDARISI